MDIERTPQEKLDLYWLTGLFPLKYQEPSDCDCECGDCATEYLNEDELFEQVQTDRGGVYAHLSPSDIKYLIKTIKYLISVSNLEGDNLLMATANGEQEETKDMLVSLGFTASDHFLGNGNSTLWLLKARVKDLKLD